MGILQRGTTVLQGLNALSLFFGVPAIAVVSMIGTWYLDATLATKIPITVVLFSCGFLIWVGWLDRYGKIRALKRPGFLIIFFSKPIAWDFSGFIAGKKEVGTQPYAGKFYAVGENITDGFVKINSGHIISSLSGRSIPIVIKTDSGYQDPSNTNPIPSKAKIYVHALFYNPNDPVAGKGLQGIPQDQFNTEFGEFIFECTYDNGRKYKRKFNIYEIGAEFDKHKPTTTTPRVTKQNVGQSTLSGKTENSVPSDRLMQLFEEGQRLLDRCDPLVRAREWRAEVIDWFNQTEKAIESDAPNEAFMYRTITLKPTNNDRFDTCARALSGRLTKLRLIIGRMQQPK